MITLENGESIYKALLKVNQIGKKLTNNSKYLLNNGVILGYSKQAMSETEANAVSVGFIEKSILKNLSGLGDKVGLLINGNSLYEMSKEHEFDSITVEKDGIKINYVYYEVNDSSYIENFKDILRSKGFKENAISIAEASNFTSDMDMYDLFLKYKKTETPPIQKSLISITCKFVETDNFIYKKCDDLMNKLIDYELIYEEDIEREILDILITGRQPVSRKLRLNNGETIKVKFMKSLFNPIASKNNASIYIYNKENTYIMGICIELAGVKLFRLYKVLNY